MYSIGNEPVTVKVFQSGKELKVPETVRTTLIDVYNKAMKTYNAEMEEKAIRCVVLEMKLNRYFGEKRKQPVVKEIADNIELYNTFLIFLAKLTSLKKEFFGISFSGDKIKQRKFSFKLAESYQSISNKISEYGLDNDPLYEIVRTVHHHVFQGQSLIDKVLNLNEMLDENHLDAEFTEQLEEVREKHDKCLQMFEEFLSTCEMYFKQVKEEDPQKKLSFQKIETAYFPYFMTTFGFDYPKLYRFVYQVNGKVKEASPELNPFRPS